VFLAALVSLSLNLKVLILLFIRFDDICVPDLESSSSISGMFSLFL